MTVLILPPRLKQNRLHPEDWTGLRSEMLARLSTGALVVLSQCDVTEELSFRENGVAVRGRGKTMNAQLQNPLRKSELSREEAALLVAARWAVALVEASLVAAVQYADDMGGLRAGDVRIDGGVPADVLEEPVGGCV